MGDVRIGMIGVGQIGKMHLDKYKDVADAEIVAIADINEAEAKDVADKYEIPNVYTDFRKLLERDDLDAVDVCLHNNYHAPVTIEVLRAGKDAYCEKPMAGAYVDAAAMLDEARARGRKLSIQLSSLFSKETKFAKRLIDAGKLGRLYHARSTGFRRRGRPFVDGYGSMPFVSKQTASGGALYDMGVYHIAQVLYLLGLPTVERISGKIYQETVMDPARREASGYDVEELGTGFVRFAGGATLDIIESWAIQLDGFEGSCVVGSRGGVRLKPLSFHHTDPDTDMEMNSTIEMAVVDSRWHALNETESAYDSPQHHWVAAVGGKVPLLPTAELALLTMLVSEGIYLSDRLDREVTAEEVIENSKSTAVKA